MVRLKKGSFTDFANRVRETGKQVALYGAGVIGQTVAPYWLSKYRIDQAVSCYVDADPWKQGQAVFLNGRQVPIKSPNELGVKMEQCVLLVTASAFIPVVRALERLRGLEEMEVYFLPVMLLDLAHKPKQERVVKVSGVPLIPKKIHYCWFSGKPIPEYLIRCLDSWRRYCPEYEIIRWDEANYDVNEIPYVEQAYRCQRWGFASDVARLDILYRHGGIYLDTDVELLRSLDELLYQPAFCATEKWGVSNSGGGIGAKAGNEVVWGMLEFHKKFPFIHKDGYFNLMSSGYYETAALMAMGMRPNGRTQRIADGQMTIYSPEFFHPFDYVSGRTEITENTFSIHHFSGTWLGENGAAERRATKEQYLDFVAGLEE